MKMRKEEGGSGMYQTNCIRSISVVALVLTLAACEKAQEPTRQAQEPAKADIQLKATKIGEVSDLVAPLGECDKRDGQKDQGIRLQIPSELGEKVSYLELLAKGSKGRWDSCTGPDKGTIWRLEVTEEGSDKPMGEALNLSKGGIFVIHAADNGAFADQSALELKGLDKDGQGVFRVEVTD